jgi:DNA-binding NarL/FixJ family response regulator
MGVTMTTQSRAKVAVCCLNRLLREAITRIIAKRTEFDIVPINPTLDLSDASSVISEINILVLDTLSAVPRLATDRSEADRDEDVVRCVLVSMDDDPEQFMKAIQMGVRGYVLRDASASDVLSAIRAVAVGEAVCPTSYTRLLFDYVMGRVGQAGDLEESARFTLTRREQQLMPLIECGKTNKEIANHLNISEQTVKNHVHRIMRKMQVSNRLEVCKVWQRQSASSTTPGSGYSFEYYPS